MILHSTPSSVGDVFGYHAVNMPEVSLCQIRGFYPTLRRDEIWPKGCQSYKAEKVDKKRLR